MYRFRKMSMVITLMLLALTLSSIALADDGRINRAPYHFGGDTLFCAEATGCTLVNLNGVELVNWPLSDISAAFANLDATGENSIVGDGQGSYGTVQLWAVPTEETNGNKKLCLIGFDEWGKENDMCFAVTLDFHFLQAALPVSDTGAGGSSVPDCSMWNIGDSVGSIANPANWGLITSINTANGTATFGAYTYPCDEIEEQL